MSSEYEEKGLSWQGSERAEEQGPVQQPFLKIVFMNEIGSQIK